MKRFADVDAFITGGSSGIGRALALALAGQGAHVHLAARREGPLDEALEAVGRARLNTAQRCSAHPLDVTDGEQVRAVFNQLAAEGAPPQVVINCAGAVAQQLALDAALAHAPGYFDTTPPEVYRRLVEINYLGAVHVCRAAAPHLRRGAHLVNVASGAVILPVPGYAAYVGSKCALVGFSEVLRYEMRPRGVRVSVAYPEDTDTPQLRAERETRAREINVIAALSSVMSAERAAQLILRGVRRGAFHIPLGTDTALIFHLLRPMEWVKFRVMDAILAVSRRRAAYGGGSAGGPRRPVEDE